jgi:hypothetical protein
MDIEDVALPTIALQLFKYIQTLINITQELDDALRPQGTRTVYVDSFRGDQLADDLRNGAAPRIFNATRLSQAQFEALLQWLISNTSFKDSKHVSAGEKLIIFLYICAHNASYRSIQELVHHSTSTIHVAFTETLDALCALHRHVVKLPPAETPEVISSSGKFYPMFKDAIGALDGTHIPICVSREKSKDAQVPWRCRKGYNSQNVLAAVDFDMNFVYVLAGWEGSAHDCRVLRNAVLEKGFKAPTDKYYLADAGYSSFNGLCLTPYHKVRYHLREWGTVNQRPKTPEELFNLRHSSLRITIERTFGVLKMRFPILKVVHEGFSIATQVKLVYALTALHNFLNKHGARPEEEWAELERISRAEDLYEPVARYNEEMLGDSGAEQRRDEIAELMWTSYHEELARRTALPPLAHELDRFENLIHGY